MAQYLIYMENVYLKEKNLNLEKKLDNFAIMMKIANPIIVFLILVLLKHF